MNNITKIVLYFSFALMAPWLADAETDYCKRGLCPYGYTHIACQNNKHFDRFCPKDAKLVEMTLALRNFIVDEFNKIRNFVAGGNVAELAPACRMGTMKWDMELAELAELNVKQCKVNRDLCHDTETYMHSGQNIGMLAYLGTANDTNNILAAIYMWYDEVEFILPSQIKQYPEFLYGRPIVGHFTAMVLERNIAIGCAASTFFASCKIYKSYLVTCNFAYDNFYEHEVYKTCSTPGEECKTGINLKYPCLCSTSEKIDVNEYPPKP